MINPEALRPLLEGDNAPHFKAAAEGRLLVQKCSSCGHHRFPFAHLCPTCLGTQADWVQASGRGQLWSWTEFHRPYFKAVQSKVPYTVVAVQLEEGAMLYGNLAEGKPEDLTIGMPMQAAFEASETGCGVVNFKRV